MHLAIKAEGSKFLWSKVAREYRYRSNGKVVSSATLTKWVEAAVNRARIDLRAIGQALLDGEINTAEFALQSAAELKNLHRALAMLAAGGKDQMGASEWGRLGARLKDELGYLRRFSSAVDNVAISSLGDKFLNRIESYANAGRFAYSSAVRAREIEAGDTLERNILGDSTDSCAECLDATALDWQPVGSLSEPGSRECQNGCNCEMEYQSIAMGNLQEESVA